MITEKALPSRGKLAQKLQDLYVRIQFVISIIKVNFKRIYPHTPHTIKKWLFLLFLLRSMSKYSICIFTPTRHYFFSNATHSICFSIYITLFLLCFVSLSLLSACAFGCMRKNKSFVFLSLHENIVILLFKISQICCVACWYFIHAYIESHGMYLQ